MKKVSIIVPCYKVEKYVSRCIDSLTSQTIGIENLEIILVNDASPDNTLSILLDYEKKFPENIIVIDSKVNRGIGGARNVGLEYANGEYIGFVDSDDWVDTSMFEKMYNKGREFDCDMVKCYSKRAHDTSVIMGRTGLKDSICNIKTLEERKTFLVEHILQTGVWNKIYRRDLLEKANMLFPEKKAYEDNLWSPIIFSYVQKCYTIEEYFYYYFFNTEGTVLKFDAKQLDRLQMQLTLLNELDARGMLDKFHDEIEYRFLQKYYIETLKVLLLLLNPPSNIVSNMQKTVKKLFPNYKNNPYIGTFPDLDLFIDTLDFNFNDDNLRKFARNLYPIQ